MLFSMPWCPDGLGRHTFRTASDRLAACTDDAQTSWRSCTSRTSATWWRHLSPTNPERHTFVTNRKIHVIIMACCCLAEYFKTGDIKLHVHVTAYRVLQLPFLVFVSPANPAWQQVSESATKPIWRHGHLIESKHSRGHRSIICVSVT